MTKFRSIGVTVVVLLFLAAFAATRSHAQDVGGSGFIDPYGEVELSVYILASSDNTEIDAYTETENFDFSGEDIEYVGGAGALVENGTTVSQDGYYDDYDVYVPLTAAAHVGDSYTMYGESYACYYDYFGEGDVDDCEGFPDDLGGFGVSINTAVPQLLSLSPSSGNQNTSGSFTVTGHNLIDDFGLAGVTVYGTGVSAQIDQSGASTEHLTIDYTIAANATIGDHNVSISTSFGESDFKKFTVGYPPAVITNIEPPIWPAGSNALPVTITGTGFGSAPTLAISALGVQNTLPATNGSGTQLQTTVTVAANAPNEPVAIQVTPGYPGQTFICGSCNGGSPVGSNTAEVQAANPPPPTIQRDMSADPNNPNFQTINGNVNVLIGERISLQAVAPQGFNLKTQTWSFASNAQGGGGITDITGGFTGMSAANPSSTTGGQEASDPDTTHPNVLFYFVNPNTVETVTLTVTYSLADNSASAQVTSSVQFTIGGPTNATINIEPYNNGHLGPLQVALGHDNNNNPYPALRFGLENPQNTADVGIYAEDSATLPANKGWFVWVQLLPKVHYQSLFQNMNHDTVQASCYPKNFNNQPQLDATYPYVSGSAGSNQPPQNDGGKSFKDSPSAPITGDTSESFSAKTYLMWDPALPAGCHPARVDNATLTETASDCLSTPVPLGYITWNWAAEGIDLLKNADNGSTAKLQPHSTSGSNHFTADTTFPQWNSAVKTHAAILDALACTVLP